MGLPFNALPRIFDPRITLGAIIQIAVLIIGIALAWGSLQTRLTVVEKAYIDQSTNISTISLKLDLMDNKLTEMAVRNAQTQQQVIDISTAQRQAANLAATRGR